MYFVLSGAVTSGTVDCTFVRTDAWLEIQPGSCVPVAQNSSKVEANAATVCLSPLFALPTSQRTGARDPDQCCNRGLFKILSTAGAALPPSTTYTRNTSLTPAIPTGNIARILVSSVPSLPKRKVMAFASCIRCILRPHLRVSICSHFSRVFCPIKKREHPVSITPERLGRPTYGARSCKGAKVSVRTLIVPSG